MKDNTSIADVRNSLVSPEPSQEITINQAARDLFCSGVYGPYLEDLICTGDLRIWQRQFNNTFYAGLYGPVIPTYTYWEYGSVAIKLAISINIVLLTAYPILLFGSYLPATITLYPGLACMPLWIIKFVSFFRGDPLYSGLSFMWIFLLYIFTFYISHIIIRSRQGYQ